MTTAPAASPRLSLRLVAGVDHAVWAELAEQEERARARARAMANHPAFRGRGSVAVADARASTPRSPLHAAR